MSRLGLLIAALAAAAAFVVLGDRAAATTFCVPNFGPACANNGSNVAEADLEKAMGLNGSDGFADKIVVAAGTLTEGPGYEPANGVENPGSYEPAGSDRLTIVGAGAGSTVLTSGGGNTFLVRLGSASAREVTIENLTLQVPAGFADGEGTAILLSLNDKLKDVEIVSLNEESNGIDAAGGGNTAVGVELRGGGAGTLDRGVEITNFNGVLTVEDATIENASWGLASSGSSAELIARRVTEIGTRTYGAAATAGRVRIENSRIVTGDSIAFFVSAFNDDATLEADHVTALNVASSTNPAMHLRRFSDGPGKLTMLVTNSILRGYSAGYRIETKSGPGIGLASLTVRYSNFRQTGSSNGVLDIATGNIDADAQLDNDLSLKPTSPSIDKGDPLFGLTTDFLGAPRPNDGDGDGTAVQDQGAFEYQRPPSPKEEGGNGGGGAGSGGSGSGAGSGTAGGGNPAPDTTPPLTKLLAGPGKALAQGKAKFRFGSSEPGSRFECKLDRGKVRACSSPKLYTGLKPGRHTFRVWAIDAAGNRAAKPVKRSFRVPA